MNKSDIINMISEEKSKYIDYLQLCSFYQITPDPIAKAKCTSKTEILDKILGLIKYENQ